MKIHLLAVGRKMPAWIQEGYREYAKRLPNDFAANLIELPLGHRGKKNAHSLAKQSEGEAIIASLKSLPGAHHVVALEVTGKHLGTEGLARKISKVRTMGKNLCLLIGGPEGLSADCLRQADECWSLSQLTLPHPLVRVVVIEQLYRVWTILQHHPYHK